MVERLVNISIPSGPFEGYLFDCDGTLAHSMPIHYRAWCQALKEAGATFDFTEDLFYSMGGIATSHIVNVLNERYGSSLHALDIAHRKEDLYMEVMEKGPIFPIPEVADFARKIAQTQPVAVVSGGFRRVVVRTLELISMRNIFEVIITPEDGVPGKPAPDMFELAAKKLGVDPKKCLVFEDAEPGIQGARAAGMEVVIIPRPSITP